MAVIGFKERISDLAGSLGTADDNALQQWILDGCYDVISKVLPTGVEEDKFAVASSSYTSSMTIALDDIRQLVNVGRNGYSCRRVSHHQRNFVDPNHTIGANSIHKATSYDPVFYILDNQFIVKPNPTVSEQGYYSYIPEYSISGFTSTSADIDNFPKEYYEHVVLYAAIQTLDRQLLDMLSNADITTALTAVKTEIGECLTIADDMHTEIGRAYTEIAEATLLTDSSTSDINTALANMNTALDKFRANASDPGLFGEEGTYDATNSEMTRVKDALDQAQNLIDGSVITNNVIDLLNDEDSEMVSSTLSAVQAEVSRAQAHIAEWNATIQALDTEIKGFAAEASARYGWVQSKSQIWQGQLAIADAYGKEMQSKLSTAQAYTGEAKARMERDSQTYQWQQERRNFLKQEYVNKFPGPPGTKGGQQ